MAQIEGYSDYVFTSSGSIWWRSRNRFLKLDGSDKAGYRLTKLHDTAGGYKSRHVHSLIAEAFFGARPADLFCDHLNRNRADNRLENLRFVTRSENARNTSRCETSSSQYFGVTKHVCGKWLANISEAQTMTYIGLYEDEKEAAQAYDVHALRLGRKPNFPTT